MMIKIDKGIPAPASGRHLKYPFAMMEIGDSFFVPTTTSSNILVCAYKHRPKRFTTRSVVENGVRGIRVWRIA